MDVGYVIRSRADGMSPELARLLARSGCHMVMFGLESGDPALLKRANKKTDLATVEESVRNVKRAGMNTVGFFIVGMPGETETTAKKTLAFSMKLPLDYALFNQMMILPHTTFYSQMQEKTGTTYWEDFVREPQEETDCGLMDTDLSMEDINRLVSMCWRKYYFRPRKLLGYVLSVRSLNEFRRKIKIAFRLLGNR